MNYKQISATVYACNKKSNLFHIFLRTSYKSASERYLEKKFNVKVELLFKGIIIRVEWNYWWNNKFCFHRNIIMGPLHKSQYNCLETVYKESDQFENKQTTVNSLVLAWRLKTNHSRFGTYPMMNGSWIFVGLFGRVPGELWLDNMKRCVAFLCWPDRFQD